MVFVNVIFFLSSFFNLSISSIDISIGLKLFSNSKVLYFLIACFYIFDVKKSILIYYEKESYYIFSNYVKYIFSIKTNINLNIKYIKTNKTFFYIFLYRITLNESY